MAVPAWSLLVSLALCGWSQAPPADEAALKRGAKAKLESARSALIRGDFGAVVDLTHPRVISLMGGRAQMVGLLESGRKKFLDQGYEFRSLRVEEPSDLVVQGDEIYAVVPFSIVLKAPGGQVMAQGFALGVSPDRGRSWSFVNGDPDSRLLRQVLPDLPERLRFPERRKATYEKDGARVDPPRPSWPIIASKRLSLG